MTQPVPKTGHLETPIFQGPPPVGRRRPPKRPTKWDKHFEIGRLHPGARDNDRGWMVVSKATKGGRAATSRAVINDRNAIITHLERWYPLERWELRVVTVADTWCDRELYMRYLGELTPEQDVADRAERRAAWERKMARSREKKARAALDARLRAQAEQSANRDKAARRR